MKAFTILSPCHPLGQSGSARPPCLTTSGGNSETPSQRLHQPNHPCSTLPLSPPSLLPLLPPPPPSPPPLLCLQALNPWTYIAPTQQRETLVVVFASTVASQAT